MNIWSIISAPKCPCNGQCHSERQILDGKQIKVWHLLTPSPACSFRLFRLKLTYAESERKVSKFKTQNTRRMEKNTKRLLKDKKKQLAKSSITKLKPRCCIMRKRSSLDLQMETENLRSFSSRTTVSEDCGLPTMCLRTSKTQHDVARTKCKLLGKGPQKCCLLLAASKRCSL